MKIYSVLILYFLSMLAFSQELTGSELLAKSIAYHDPQGQWSNFQGTLVIELTMPDRPNRTSEVTLNLPNQYFKLKATRDGTVTERSLDRGSCSFSLNGNSTPTAEEIEKHRGDCERTQMMRNYYTYLYGLPMKLKDPGTHVHEKVIQKTFKGKEYLVLKVTYDEAVGSDTWYFYFDPNTYAMEVYQFFKNESKNDGEYILLKDLMEVKGIKMPKTRAWYYNNNDGYLGTDDLMKAE